MGYVWGVYMWCIMLCICVCVVCCVCVCMVCVWCIICGVPVGWGASTWQEVTVRSDCEGEDQAKEWELYPKGNWEPWRGLEHEGGTGGCVCGRIPVGAVG